MARIAEPSVQSLLIQMQYSGRPLATGTAFVLIGRRGPVLITNRHNLTGRHQDTGRPLSDTGGVPNEVVIIHNRKDKLGEWLTRVEPLYDDNRPRWFEHPKLGEKGDIVGLPLTQLDDVHLYPYKTSAADAEIHVGPGEVVSVVGFPFGIQGGGSLAVWATGFVASEPEVNFGDLPIFLIDCRSRPGQSGSAVIAYRSGGSVAMADGSSAIFSGPITRFLGVYSGRINSESDLGIVWKVSAVQQLIDSI